MKKILSILILVTLLASAFCIMSFASDVVIINTAEELSAVMRESDKWSGNYKLGADIDMRGNPQRSMGTYDIPFSGTFDGDGHSVCVTLYTEGTAGLFGVLSGTVKNVKVYGEVKNTFFTQSAEAKINGKYSGTGGVVGVALSGATVENCISSATVDGSGNTGGVVGLVYNFGYDSVTVSGCEYLGKVYSTAGNCGGVIGRIYVSSSAFPAVTVKNCINRTIQSLKIDNRNRFGGIVGYIRSEAGVVIVEDCTNNGDITAENFSADAASNDYPYAGGIVGRVEATGDISSGVQISKCSNTARITSGKYAGGIVTYIQRSEACSENATFISECINTGVVEAPRFVGGILGYSEVKVVGEPISYISNCANYGGVYGTEYAGGILGRQYGMTVKECISMGTVKGNPCGMIIAVSEGAIYCESDECYYLDSGVKPVGKESTMCVVLGIEPVKADDVKTQATYKYLDFDNIWTMGESGPTLKMLTGESTSGNVDDDKEVSPFVSTRTYEGQFADVAENQWFYEYVKTSYEYSLANGTSNTSFSPEGKFTVAQALTAAANIHKVYFAKEVREAYPGESWYAPYVSYCIDNGIIRYGMFDNYDRNITRGEMAIVFANILPDSEYAAVKEGSNPDVTADMGCYDAVAKLFKAGIVGGDAGSGNYRPNDEIVRSEACVIFTRIALAEKRAK